MYAIVRSGGRQHKVAVGDVLEIDRLESAVGSSVSLKPLLLVDGDSRHLRCICPRLGIGDRRGPC